MGDSHMRQAGQQSRPRERVIPTLLPPNVQSAVPHHQEKTASSHLCCRICLSTHSKLISMESYGLKTAYKQLSGLSVQYDGLPRELCVECATLLLKYNKFRNKTRMAYGLLNNMCPKNYKDIFVRKLKLKVDNVHSPLKYSNVIVHLDIEPDFEVRTDENNINSQSGKNDLFDKIEIIDLNTVKDDPDSEDSNIYNDDWTLTELNDDTNDVMDDKIVHESSDLSQIDDDIVHNDDSLTDSTHVNKKSKKIKSMKGIKKRKEVKTLIYDKKFEEDLNKLLIDESSETYWEDLENRYRGKQLNLCEILKKRHALVNECFDKKTMLSLEEQRDSFEKMKLEDSYVKAKYKCELCYKGLVTEQYLHNHIKKYHSEALGEYVCQLCKWRCKKEKLLLFHVKRAHVYEYQCKFCYASFTNLVRAESHAKFHKGIKFVCQHCEKQFEGYTAYMSHVRIAHPSDSVCVHCGYSFVNEIGLNQHIKRAHKEQADFADVPCKSCELKFASEEALVAHVRIKHPKTDQKPMYNDRQAAVTRQHSILNRKCVGENKPYRRRLIQFPVPCEMCGLEQSSGLDYRKHFAKEHPNFKRTFLVNRFYPHICEKCGRGFQNKYFLKDHLLTHGSEYTVQCTKCDKKFKSTQQMKTHLYSHEEPLECHICGASITKTNLRRHIVHKHSEVKSFKCDLCGKCFKTKGEVRSHTRHVHMNIPWPRKRKDGPPLRKRREVQKHSRESETEESNHAACNDSNEF